MKEIDRSDVEKLTALSRIKCVEEEVEALVGDLQNILARFEELEEIDTEDVEACNTVLEGLSNVMRDDIVGDVLAREAFLQNCPSTGGMVRVPTVLK